MSANACRFCGAPLSHSFCDLGMSPLSNANLRADQLNAAEKFYPLHAYVCDRCWLVQLPDHETPENIFARDYAYFSSYSDTWLAHARAYVEEMIARFGYGAHSHVVEIASNDGYLLQYFQRRGVPVTGIEPAPNCARVAQDKGIPTEVRFFGVAAARELAAQGRCADLLLGNNVLAHVPDLNDFVAGLPLLLKPGGVVTMEFPHLLRLIEGNQFDTIYQEHYSYLSLLTVERVFARHGLVLFDVQELPTHGGSLRIFARHAADASRPVGAAVQTLRRAELAAGLADTAAYAAFADRVCRTRYALLEFLIAARRQGKTVWGYGAPAKGNTLLNYCGIRGDLLAATVDRSPHKQGLFLPGTHIPILAPEAVAAARPDYLLILPWNLRDEITGQMAYIRQWGGRFVVPIPEVEVLP
ncbi:MAG: class I SAM-dependent methyltransferase [Nevskia sp.]|nr:class I SAM-dependent methyltransferase [Nevskia sp.]